MTATYCDSHGIGSLTTEPDMFGETMSVIAHEDGSIFLSIIDGRGDTAADHAMGFEATQLLFALLGDAVEAGGQYRTSKLHPEGE